MNSAILLNWAVLTLSFFLTISLFWLGLMVLLVGNRRSFGTWLAGGGLLFGALFFTSHTAILGRGLSNTSLGMDFWWWVSWTPAVTAPLTWYSAMLWYADYRFRPPHRHHALFLLVLLLAISIVFLLIFVNPLPSYQYVAGRTLLVTPHLGGVPLLILVYLLYSLLCYLLPVDLLRRSVPGRPLEIETRRRARPYLLTASIAMLLAGGILALTALWAVKAQPTSSLADESVVMIVLRFDLVVELLVAAAVMMLGRSIVGFEVFTGRLLPRNRFFRNWRSTMILAAGYGSIAAWTLVVQLRPIYSLMLATALMVLFYALFSWRSFTEREDFMTRLRPFLRSQNLYSQITSLQSRPEARDYPLFETLCRDVLEVRTALLMPLGVLNALAGPPLDYPRGCLKDIPKTNIGVEMFHAGQGCLPAKEVWSACALSMGYVWAIGLWSPRGLDGILFLGEKVKRYPFTEEEIDIAQTAGERMLDILAGGEMAFLTMDLLRQRLAQSKVLEGQGRRVLHDEILPQLHAALLYLNSEQTGSADVGQAVDMLSSAHHRIADLMRDIPTTAPNLLAQKGLAAALRQGIEGEFANRFERIEWRIEEEALRRANALPLFVNEVLYFAARELVRNAAQHAGGTNPDAQICLKVEMICEKVLSLVVEDNGVGFQGQTTRFAEITQPNKGNGLRIHSAMLAAVGARLALSLSPTGGTRAVIVFL